MPESQRSGRTNDLLLTAGNSLADRSPIAVRSAWIVGVRGLWHDLEKFIDAEHSVQERPRGKDGSVIKRLGTCPHRQSERGRQNSEIYGGLVGVIAGRRGARPGWTPWSPNTDPIPPSAVPPYLQQKSCPCMCGWNGRARLQHGIRAWNRNGPLLHSLVAATDAKDPTAEDYLASGGMGLSSTSECSFSTCSKPPWRIS